MPKFFELQLSNKFLEKKIQAFTDIISILRQTSAKDEMKIEMNEEKKIIKDTTSSIVNKAGSKSLT